MRKGHSKIGNRPGKPAYRTSAVFRYKQNIKVQKFKSGKKYDR